jgi:hypothetical protein
MVVQTNLIFSCFDALLGDGLTTSARMIKFVDDTQDIVHAPNVRVGPIIGAQFLVDIPGFEDTREELFRDTDARVGLTILEQHVITRVVFLDEGVFQEQGILFCVHNRIADIEDFADEHFCLEAINFCVEV